MVNVTQSLRDTDHRTILDNVLRCQSICKRCTISTVVTINTEFLNSQNVNFDMHFCVVSLLLALLCCTIFTKN